MEALHSNLAQFGHTAAGSVVTPVIMLGVALAVILWAIGQ